MKKLLSEIQLVASDHNWSLQFLLNDFSDKDDFEFAILKEAIESREAGFSEFSLALVNWALSSGFTSDWLKDNKARAYLALSESKQACEIWTSLLHESNDREVKAAAAEAIGSLSTEPVGIKSLLKQHEVLRSAGKHHKALIVSKKIIEQFPDYFDGYARAAQDCLSLNKPNRALKFVHDGRKRPNSADNIWLLMSGLSAAIAVKDFDLATRFGYELNRLHEIPHYSYMQYLFALIKVGKLMTADSISLDALQHNHRDLNAVDARTKVLLRSQRFEECRWHLYTSFQFLESRDDCRFITEEIYHLDTRVVQLNSAVEHLNGCDVICIASNEAPYIHEFIHHYIYMGFRNIFVGCNNCSDETIDILNKIRVACPQVILLDVNSEMSCFKQWGCYHKIFDYAFLFSRSKYCLMVDIDEFWIADPFPLKIDDFVESCPSFDVFSFYWIEALDNNCFDVPLSPHATYKSSDWVKSLMKYDVPLSRIGVHGPILNDDIANIKVRLLGEINVNTHESLHGVEVLGQCSSSAQHPVSGQAQAWIIHRANRSEIEYSHRLLKPHANDNPSSIAFKSNRYGWRSNECGDKLFDSYIKNIVGESVLKEYHSSLELFQDICKIRPEIERSRSLISDSSIVSFLESMSMDILRRDSNIARQIFKGTRFIKIIEQRLSLSSD